MKEPVLQPIPLPIKNSMIDAYHGTKKSNALKALNSKKFHKSINPGDWLGHGIYFWEDNPSRAKMWADEHSNGEESSVLKTRIKLGKCLDLSDGSMAAIVKVAYNRLKEEYDSEGKDMPINDPDDPKNHRLDCAVMNFLPRIVEIDTIRAPFYEGAQLFPGSFLLSYSHIQIVVINEDNIIGGISLFS